MPPVGAGVGLCRSIGSPSRFRIHPDLYDVVIVDESLAGGDSRPSSCSNLAPKIVVIGDDKQGVAIRRGWSISKQLRDLANQYLATDPYRASWLDPKRSYFDEAAMRFGGRITLTEHRRCVPEIIGFSNRLPTSRKAFGSSRCVNSGRSDWSRSRSCTSPTATK